MKIRINKFQGLAPRFNRRQIPVGAAQIAENLRFDSGDLKPFQRPVDTSIVLGGATLLNAGTMFWHVDEGAPISERLIVFGSDFEVTASRTPVPNDHWRRWYWCVRGDGMYSISFHEDPPYPNGQPVGTGNSYRPFGGRRVGIPAPQEAPEARAVQSDPARVGWHPEGKTQHLIQSIARTNPATINWVLNPQLPSVYAQPFKSGQRVRLRVNPAYPRPGDDGEGPIGPPPGFVGPMPPDPDPDNGQIWGLEGVEGVVSNILPNSFELVGVDASVFSEFSGDDLQNLYIEEVFTDQDMEDRAYVFTYVNEFDEEGPPSAPSNVVTLPKEGAALVDVGDINWQAAHGGSRNINRIRIYRTVAGETATLYVLVGTLNYAGGGTADDRLTWDVPPSAPNPELAWAGTALDRVRSIELGKPIPSEGWYPPPNGLWGIVQLPNGIMAGWKGNTLYFSEPFLPSAWNPDYSITLDEDVVGVSSFGSSLVVGTRGRPYMVSGSDPSAMQAKKLEHHAPLLHSRAIADAGSGVIYSSSNGLVWVGAGGTQVMTGLWDEHSWMSVAGPRSRLVWFDGYALLFDWNQDPLILSMVDNTFQASYLTSRFSCAVRRNNDLAVAAWHSDGLGSGHRKLLLLDREVDMLNQPHRMTGKFRSGMVAFHRPINAGVAQVFADGYPLDLTLRAIRPESYLNPTVGQPELEYLAEYHYTVEGPEPFRLVPGYLSREYEVEISSRHRVQEVLIGTDMDDIRREQ